jgi:hypothetical protein
VNFLSGAEIVTLGAGTVVPVSEIEKINGHTVSVEIEFLARSKCGNSLLRSITITDPREFLDPIREDLKQHQEHPGGEPAFSWTW